MLAAAVAVGGCAPWLERPLAGLAPAPSPAPAPDFGHPPPQIESGGAPDRTHPVGPTPPFAGGTADIPEVSCRTVPYDTSGWLGIDDPVQIGPLLFPTLAIPRSRERFDRGSMPLLIPVVIPPQTRAVISVPDAVRGRAGLDDRAGTAPVPPRDAHTSILCAAGPAQRTARFSVVLSKPQCLPLTVTADGREDTLRIAFGVRRCP